MPTSLLRTLAPTLLLFAGCLSGGGTGDDGDDVDASTEACPDDGRYMELRTGASWTYRIDDGAITEKSQTVGDLEDLGGAKAGTMAYRMTTEKPSGGIVESWQEDTGESIVRHRELDMAGSTSTDETYLPFRTRIDSSAAHTTVGATWDEAYTEQVSENGGAATSSDKVETWTVVSVNEVITVPAGEFCTMRLRRVSLVNGEIGSDKSYWFARGVGKIKETGAGQIETLVSYTE